MRLGPVRLPMALLAALTACSSHPPAIYGPLDEIGIEGGHYPRVETTGADGRSLLILAFSGGGKRAAAFAQGTLDAMRATPLADGRTMLDEVDILSSVSVGSLTAANFALHGADDDFGQYRENFLYYDAQSELKRELLYTPAVVYSVLIENRRIEAFVRILEERIAPAGKTFADLRADAPYLILNTTDIARGLGFPLTQYQFDVICADLDRMPLARAIAASAAYPVLLSSVAIANRAPCPAQFEGGAVAAPTTTTLVAPLKYLALMAQPGGSPGPIAPEDDPYKRERGQRSLRYLSDPDYRYLHLYDGGIADNLGLAEPLWLLTDLGGPWKGSFNKYLRRDGELQRITVLSVNARSDPDAAIPEDDDPPSMLGTVTGVIGGAIDRRSTGLLAQAALSDDGFIEVINTSRLAAQQLEYRWADLAFDRLTDQACARQLSNLPTDWALERHEVDALTLIGAALTFGTRAYQDQAAASAAKASPAAMDAQAARLAEAACTCLEDARSPGCSATIARAASE
jgi:NTE family protein